VILLLGLSGSEWSVVEPLRASASWPAPTPGWRPSSWDSAPPWLGSAVARRGPVES
jgi:hypothetical protein